MLVIPAIDLRGGRCVRRQSGDAAETVTSDDPVRLARLWRVMNARVLHLVDLGTARPSGSEADRGGASDNLAVIERVAAAVQIPVQVGGGLRTLEAIEAMLARGVSRVILGAAAIHDPDLVSRALEAVGDCRVVVGIDARDGEACAEDRETGSGVDAVELALDMEARGVRRVVYTDVSREGTLAGPALDACRALASRLTRMKVTASGGVGDYRDLLALQTLEELGVDSVVVGRALYDNRFPCQQFWAWHREDVDLDTVSSAPLAPVRDGD